MADVNQPAVATPEPGVATATATEGAAFLSEMLGGVLSGGNQPAGGAPTGVVPAGMSPAPVAPAPVPPGPAGMAPGFGGAGQPAAVPLTMPSAGAGAPPVAGPVAAPAPTNVPAMGNGAPMPAAQAATPAPIDLTQRYSGAQSTPDFTSTLQPAPELPAEVQVAEPQNLSPQQNHAWASIRAQSTQNRRVAEEYRTKYNQLVEATKQYQTEKQSFTQQLSEKDAQIRALEDDIGRMDLTKSPAFREKYDVPIQQVQARIVETMRSNGMSDADAVDLARRVLTSDPANVPQLISHLPTYAQGVVMVEAEQGDALFNARDAALAEWRTTAEGLEEVQQRGGAIVNSQYVDKMVGAAIDILHSMPASSMPPAYQVTDPTFVADRANQEQRFRSWVQQAPEDQKYAAMLEGFMAPKTYEMLARVMQENNQLRSVLQARGQLAAPPVMGGTVAPPVITPVVPPPAPTVQRNGFSAAPETSMAQDFARGLLSQFTQ